MHDVYVQVKKNTKRKESQPKQTQTKICTSRLHGTYISLLFGTPSKAHVQLGKRRTWENVNTQKK